MFTTQKAAACGFFDWKYLFWVNLIQKINFFCFRPEKLFLGKICPNFSVQIEVWYKD